MIQLEISETDRDAIAEELDSLSGSNRVHLKSLVTGNFEILGNPKT